MTRTAIEQARELGHRRGLASDLSQALRDLDRLEKRVTIDAAFAVRLAAMLINLEGIRKALPRDDGSPQASYFRTEHASLSAGVNTALRQYIQQTGDHRPSTLGLQAWARKILLANKAEREAAEARRSVRATFKASGTCRRCGKTSDTLNTADGICHSCFLRSQQVRGKKPTTLRGALKKSRAGRCNDCRKQVDYLTTSGVCTPCLEKTYPEIARRR